MVPSSTYSALWDTAPYFVVFVGLVAFLCFEAVQVVRGRVHLGGIARAALELLIVSPVIFLSPLRDWQDFRVARAESHRGNGIQKMVECPSVGPDLGSLDSLQGNKTRT